MIVDQGSGSDPNIYVWIMRSGKVNLAYQYCIYDACYVGQMLHIILCKTDSKKCLTLSRSGGRQICLPFPILTVCLSLFITPYVKV